MQWPRSIKILIVEDQELIRYGIRMLIRNHGALTLVGETGSGLEAVELLPKLKPDLVLMDLQLSASDGVSCTRQIKQLAPETLVLVLTAFNDREHVMSAMTAGADGYCLKNIATADLIDAIHAVASGEPYIDSSLANEVYDNGKTKEEQQPENKPALSVRELDVLRLIMKGATNPQIAKELTISIETVKSHIKNILEKLSATDRTHAAIEAIKLGLV